MSAQKRNYIRRKKYLNNSYERIKQTMEYINSTNKLQMSESELEKLSMSHAQAVEAACWSPRLKVTSADYEFMIKVKTEELCRALSRRYFHPTFNQMQFQIYPSLRFQAVTKEEPKSWIETPNYCSRPNTPQYYPIPIVPRSAPIPGRSSSHLLIEKGEKSVESKALDPTNDVFETDQDEETGNPFGFEADSIFRDEMHSVSCDFDTLEFGFKL